MTTRTIAVFGLFGGTNLGNEATLQAVLAGVRERIPDARIVCISPPGSPYAGEYGVDFVPINPLPISQYFWRLRASRVKDWLTGIARLATEPLRRRRATKALQGVSTFVVAGTGVIEDYEQGPLDLPMSLLRWTLAARKVGARVAYLSVGAGPVVHGYSKVILRKATKLTQLRSFRDEYSRDYMKRLRFDASGDPVVPDLAFGLPVTSPVGPNDWPPKVVGVGVMTYVGWHLSAAESERVYAAYRSGIVDFLRWLCAEGLDVRLLVGDVTGDERIVADIRSAFEGRDEVSIPKIETVRELVAALDPTDLVVATRYHNQLFSLLLEKPVIGINYSPKGDALMAAAGLDGYCQDIEDLDVDRLQRDVLSLMASERPPLEGVRRCRQEATAAVAMQFDRLFGATAKR